ncbi:MAG: lysophospholipid acyltransferase family protein [Desulfobacteraceae bacterium]|nr:lysophospholipid acyltransferase family protein [Desulfobacteraceae bacterium]
MFKKIKWIIYTRPFIIFAYYLIQVYSLTFRLKVINEETWQNHVKNKETILLCTWHQQFFAAIRHFRSYSRLNPGLMISRSKDGDLISGVANRTGWHTPRGSSSRGGRQAMMEMIDHLKTYGLGAHIVDGPTGPIGIVKPGVIKMVHETDALVVPFYVEAKNAWHFNSWDKFMLPKPFSRVDIIFEDPRKLSPVNSNAEFDLQRQNLEAVMKPYLIVS